MFDTSLTIAVALAGAYAARRLKIPAGALIGGMLSAAVLSILTGRSSLPANTRLTLQIMTGVMLGCGISMADIRIFRQMIRPVLLMAAGIVVLNISVGLLIHRFSPLSLSTALFASAPGGVSDMALIADEMGADTSMVSFLQLFRLFFIYAAFPSVIRYFHGHQADALISIIKPIESPAKPVIKTIIKPADLFLTFTTGIIGGLLVDAFGMPAGGLVGALVSTAVWQVRTGRGVVPGGLRFLVQAGAGGLIGSRMTMDSIRAFPSLLVPFLLMAVSLVVFTYFFGIIMSRVSSFDLPTSMLCVSPGGITEMSLMADEFDCGAAKVVTMHTVRIIVVIGILPSIIRFLL